MGEGEGANRWAAHQSDQGNLWAQLAVGSELVGEELQTPPSHEEVMMMTMMMWPFAFSKWFLMTCASVLRFSETSRKSYEKIKWIGVGLPTGGFWWEWGAFLENIRKKISQKFYENLPRSGNLFQHPHSILRLFPFPHSFPATIDLICLTSEWHYP